MLQVDQLMEGQDENFTRPPIKWPDLDQKYATDVIGMQVDSKQKQVRKQETGMEWVELGAGEQN